MKKHAHNTHTHIYALTQGTTKVSIIYYILKVIEMMSTNTHFGNYYLLCTENMSLKL